MKSESDVTVSQEQLDAIQEMAAHGFDIDEIAEVISTPDESDEVCTQREKYQILKDFHEHGKVYTYYRKGFLKSQLDLRQRIFKDAKNGSSPAQTLAKKIMDDCEYKHNQ